MSSDSNASSPTIEAGDRDARSPTSRRVLSKATFKYLLFIAIPIIWIIAALLSYPAPTTFRWLIWLYIACVPALFILFLGALFRRRWKEVAIFCAMAPVVLLPYLLPYLGLNMPLRWFYVEGFRFHASPIDQYLSRCKLIEFVEKDAKQKVGVCERQWEPGDATLAVIYDTTGELVLPVSQRTPEWTKAMGRFSPGKFFTRSEDRAEHLLGNFYEISVPLEEADGTADDY